MRKDKYKQARNLVDDIIYDIQDSIEYKGSFAFDYIEVSDLKELCREQRWAKQHKKIIRSIEINCYEDSEELFVEGKLIASKKIWESRV